MESNRQQHWQKVYKTKQAHEVSWTQDLPKTSLEFIHSFRLPKTASIVDIGGGDSKLVDFLLDEGYEDITVLDISEEALNKSKKRLGNKASKVKWLVSDVTEFKPDRKFDIWHDRATFHFLITEEEVKRYLDIASKSVKGYLTIGTFSDKGPHKCSGLDVKQYTEDSLSETLNKEFDKIRCVTEDHITPFKTRQNFLFCSFKKHLN